MGIALEKWLTRMYTSKDKNRKRTVCYFYSLEYQILTVIQVRSDLAILVDSFQTLINFPALKCFRERIVKALRSLLQLYQDHNLILDELPSVITKNLDQSIYNTLEDRCMQF